MTDGSRPQAWSRSRSCSGQTQPEAALWLITATRSFSVQSTDQSLCIRNTWCLWVCMLIWQQKVSCWKRGSCVVKVNAANWSSDQNSLCTRDKNQTGSVQLSYKLCGLMEMTSCHWRTLLVCVKIKSLDGFCAAGRRWFCCDRVCWRSWWSPLSALMTDHSYSPSPLAQRSKVIHMVGKEGCGWEALSAPPLAQWWIDKFFSSARVYCSFFWLILKLCTCEPTSITDLQINLYNNSKLYLYSTSKH